MATEPDEIDISAMPELARLAHEVARRGRTCRLTEHGTAVAILAPVPVRRVKSRKLTTAQREAILATAGGWVGLVDPEKLKRDLREGRSDDRPPVEL